MTIKGFFSVNGLEIVRLMDKEDEVNFLQSHADEVSADIAETYWRHSATSRTSRREIDEFLALTIAGGNSASEDLGKPFIVEKWHEGVVAQPADRPSRVTRFKPV